MYVKEDDEYRERERERKSREPSVAQSHATGHFPSSSPRASIYSQLHFVPRLCFRHNVEYFYSIYLYSSSEFTLPRFILYSLYLAPQIYSIHKTQRQCI